MIKLIIVSPCYNEETVLEQAAACITAYLDKLAQKGKISEDSKVLYVNDGSTDNTWNIIRQLHEKNPRILGVNLAHNVGHQNAIMAGMMEARKDCDAVVTMDCDLQDDVNAIEKMLDKHREGADIVYGVKVCRKGDSWKKRTTAQMFYKMLEIMGVNTVYNHADFRLMSQRALNALAEFPERNLYLRGLVPLIGFQTSMVEDVILPRIAGESKYTLRKMLKLASDGITSFSTRPMELIITVGGLMLFVAFCMLCYVLGSLMLGHYTSGWASIMISMWFIGAVVTLAIGVVGMYIGKIYTETKRRPLYIIQDKLTDNKN